MLALRQVKEATPNQARPHRTCSVGPGSTNRNSWPEVVSTTEKFSRVSPAMRCSCVGTSDV